MWEGYNGEWGKYSINSLDISYFIVLELIQYLGVTLRVRKGVENGGFKIGDNMFIRDTENPSLYNDLGVATAIHFCV